MHGKFNMTNNIDNIVTVTNLKKHFGAIKAVDDISFQVQKGEVLGFLGPNGAGKSTTMKMLTCFLSPDSGTASLLGHDIIKSPEMVRKSLGYLPENAPAYEDMTVYDFLDFISAIRGFSNIDKKTRISKVTELVSIENVLYQSIGTLSKGFKRRVCLAQALIHDPDILILDEPTDGLDPNQKFEVRQLIRKMSKEKVIILSTHILEEVDEVCTRAIIISNGKIVADGTPKSLRDRSRYSGVIHLDLNKNDAASAFDFFKSLSEIDHVDQSSLSDDLIQLDLFPKNKTQLVNQVAHICDEKRWNIYKISVNPGNFSEVFRDITTKNQNLKTPLETGTTK